MIIYFQSKMEDLKKMLSGNNAGTCVTVRLKCDKCIIYTTPFFCHRVMMTVTGRERPMTGSLFILAMVSLHAHNTCGSMLEMLETMRQSTGLPMKTCLSLKPIIR